jgi:hypothetical protein
MTMKKTFYLQVLPLFYLPVTTSQITMPLILIVQVMPLTMQQIHNLKSKSHDPRNTNNGQDDA